MKPIIIPKGGKIAVVGDIHEHEEQFDKLIALIDPSPIMLLVSVGDIYDKGFGTEVAESIVDKFKVLKENGHGFVIRGNHELKRIRLGRRHKAMTPQLRWMRQQPLSLSFEFANRSRVTVVHGGVRPGHTADDLNSNVETCYVRTLDEEGKHIQLERKVVDGRVTFVPKRPGGKLWHGSYDGRFGYIVSGHAAQNDGTAKFYNYSCNLDSAVYHTGILTAQVFSENGREDLITVKGTPKWPDLEELERSMNKGMA
jgi:predicted phosphodiesterase